MQIQNDSGFQKTPQTRQDQTVRQDAGFNLILAELLGTVSAQAKIPIAAAKAEGAAPAGGTPDPDLDTQAQDAALPISGDAVIAAPQTPVVANVTPSLPKAEGKGQAAAQRPVSGDTPSHADIVIPGAGQQKPDIRHGDTSAVAAFLLHTQDRPTTTIPAAPIALPINANQKVDRAQIIAPGVSGFVPASSLPTPPADTKAGPDTNAPNQPVILAEGGTHDATSDTAAKVSVTTPQSLAAVSGAAGQAVPHAAQTLANPRRDVLSALHDAPTQLQWHTAAAQAEKLIINLPPHIRAVHSTAPVTDPAKPFDLVTAERGLALGTTYTGPIGASYHSYTPPIPTGPHPPLVQQAVLAITTALRHGQTGQIDLTLRPAELGQLRFEMTTVGERIHVLIAAERPEAMDLLRRNADQLMADLRQSGFGQATFSFGQWRARDPSDQAAQKDADDDATAGSALPFAASQPILAPRAPAEPGRLDLRL